MYYLGKEEGKSVRITRDHPIAHGLMNLGSFSTEEAAIESAKKGEYWISVWDSYIEKWIPLKDRGRYTNRLLDLARVHGEIAEIVPRGENDQWVVKFGDDTKVNLTSFGQVYPPVLCQKNSV